MVTNNFATFSIGLSATSVGCLSSSSSDDSDELINSFEVGFFLRRNFRFEGGGGGGGEDEHSDEELVGVVDESKLMADDSVAESYVEGGTFSDASSGSDMAAGSASGTASGIVLHACAGNGRGRVTSALESAL